MPALILGILYIIMITAVVTVIAVIMQFHPHHGVGIAIQVGVGGCNGGGWIGRDKASRACDSQA